MTRGGHLGACLGRQSAMLHLCTLLRLVQFPFFGVKCQLYIDYVNKLYFLGRRIQYNVVGELLVIDQGGLHQGRRCCGRRWE